MEEKEREKKGFTYHLLIVIYVRFAYHTQSRVLHSYSQSQTISFGVAAYVVVDGNDQSRFWFVMPCSEYQNSVALLTTNEMFWNKQLDKIQIW